MKNIFENNKKTLIVLLIAVFLFNIFYSFAYQIDPVVDAAAYDNIAWNFSQGNGYIESNENIGVPQIDNSIARVGPGFQFFLAGIYSIFGHHIEIVWVAHALLRVLTVLLIFLISRRLFSKYGNEIGLVAGAIFGLMPDLVLVQAMLLTETLGLFLLALSVWLALRLVDNPRLMTTFFLGSSLAFATWTRPTTLLIWVVMLGFLLWRRYYKQLLLLLVTTVLIMTPWTVRNLAIYDHFIPTSATGGYDLWVGNNPDAIGGFDKTPEIQRVRDTLHIVELETYGFRKYFEFIKEKPLKFAELQFRKTTMYFSGIRPTGWWSFLKNRPVHQAVTLVLSGLTVGLLLLLGLAGAWVLFRKRNDLKTRLFLLFALFQPLTVIPVIVEARYRYPLFPFLAVFTAFLLVLWWKEKEERKYIHKVVGWTFSILLLISAIDFAYNFKDIMARIKRF